jgi:hypothetical protein
MICMINQCKLSILGMNLMHGLIFKRKMKMEPRKIRNIILSAMASMTLGFGACQFPPCESQDEPFFYRKWRGCDLPGQIGSVEGTDRVVSNLRGDERSIYFLTYGPYIALKKGMYWGCVYFSHSCPTINAVLSMDVVSSLGQNVIVEAGMYRYVKNRIFNNSSSPASFNFYIADDVSDIEIRTKVGSYFDGWIKTHSIVLFQIGGHECPILINNIKSNQLEIGKDQANQYLITQENTKKEQAREQGREELRPSLEAAQSAASDAQQQVLNLTQQLLAAQARAGNLDADLQKRTAERDAEIQARNQDRTHYEQEKERELATKREEVTSLQDRLRLLELNAVCKFF